MPRDFKKFAKDNENVLHENKEKTNEYEQILNKYKDMNQSELMSNLFSEASKLKKEGKLDSDSLNSLQSTLSPFLNSQQKDMLSSLINSLNQQS